MYSVYQHWDPLKVCVVGRSYPPEFYSWIKVPHVRELFEKMAIETEEDYQNIIKKLESFGVEVLRPELPSINFINNKFVPPPMTPRDESIMIGDVFYESYSHNLLKFYNNIKDPAWPECNSDQEVLDLPQHMHNEFNEIHLLDQYTKAYSAYDKIYQKIRDNGNTVKSHVEPNQVVNGAMVSRIGKDLYFSIVNRKQIDTVFDKFKNQEFPNYRHHTINTMGHGDSTYCPVCPGLIISLYDVPTYAKTFPGWEVIYLPNQSWNRVRPFLSLKKKNAGKWWIPGFEHDQDVIDVVETWLGHWTGYVEETVFDVNMLIVDPKNVIVFSYNKQVFDALERYGITPHIVPFRHRYFWDGGVHCVTSDIHREGTMQDYFKKGN
jgi:hypothetical protein